MKVFPAMLLSTNPAADIIGKCHARLSEKSAQPKLICRLRISRLLQTAAEWAPL